MTPEEMGDLLDEISAGLGCTPYLDGGAIDRAEAALSKLRPALAQAHAEGRAAGKAAALEAAALWCEADAEEYGSGTEKAYALRRASTALRTLAAALAGQPSGDAKGK